MREIKFRLWDGVINKMILWEQIRKERFANIEKQSNLYLMQYTGLKDKNGKEIYEGDIVLIVGQLVAEIFFDIYEGVKIKYHYENIRTKISGKMIEPIARNHHFTHEVIGNIYENLELLNQK